MQCRFHRCDVMDSTRIFFWNDYPIRGSRVKQAAKQEGTKQNRIELLGAMQRDDVFWLRCLIYWYFTRVLSLTIVILASHACSSEWNEKLRQEFSVLNTKIFHSTISSQRMKFVALSFKLRGLPRHTVFNKIQ